MKINPQIASEIGQCVKQLRAGGYSVFPGETGWSIGCDAMNERLVKNIVDQPGNTFPEILLDDAGKLNKFVKAIPDPLWDLTAYTTRPMQLYLRDVVNLPSALLSDVGEAAFRIVKEGFEYNMVHQFGRPVFAAHLDTLPAGGGGARTILNTPCYVVNLRIGANANTGALVILRLLPGGRIEFLKK